jgi:hypothetical protein
MRIAEAAGGDGAKGYRRCLVGKERSRIADEIAGEGGFCRGGELQR